MSEPRSTWGKKHTDRCEATGCPCYQAGIADIVTDISQCRAWLGSPERDAAPSRHVRDLESFGDPEHWWITDAPVLARLG